ncbi:U3 small nucleolar RNA-associated 21 homolog [Olea europaea subsp. europaea]|uniref:U3 small nucleolar RNA-associated 21 homolog n=1 Tax=Olea europaea subsp. europaea TaxID=158383 RepID=A0A8S0SGV4_OLEEU|nr:U3 small nucleolar RNA-associated 21 homolog [Olea europaea subsp. europaea]
MNTIVISAGYRGDVKVCNFKTLKMKSRLEIGCSLVKIIYHRSNGLLATVADDLVIRLFDVVALRIVRKFEGHTDCITDTCFIEDGKWLLTSSMDGTFRILDVILAKQIDAISVDVSITALSLSPCMDVLVLVDQNGHVDQNGVCGLIGAMFSGTSSKVYHGSGKGIVSVKLPSVSSAEDSIDNDIKKASANPPQVQCVSHSILDQQIPDLVTLSLSGLGVSGKA